MNFFKIKKMELNEEETAIIYLSLEDRKTKLKERQRNYLEVLNDESTAKQIEKEIKNIENLMKKLKKVKLLTIDKKEYDKLKYDM